MMPAMLGRLDVQSLKVRTSRSEHLRWLIFREWCFTRLVVRLLWPRVVVTLLFVLAGAWVFARLDPEVEGSLLTGSYYTWSLILGEAPSHWPRSGVLQILYFGLPLLGLVVIVQSLVDVAVLVRDRQRHERKWSAMMAQSLSDHIVLVGLGRLGVSSFTVLRRLGRRVVVIENNPANQFLEIVRRDGSPLIIGDARRENILAEANIERACAVLLTTTDDLANLEIALDARRLNPRVRVVLRMFDQAMADKVAGAFNIQQAMSQSAVSAPSFALAAMEASIVGSTIVNDRLIVMVDWTVRPGDGLCDRSIGDVIADRGIGIVERRAQGAEPALFPPPATMLTAGDRLTLQGEYDRIMKLRAT